MTPEPLPEKADPRLWRRHLIMLQGAAMRANPAADPIAARAAVIRDVLSAARARFPNDYPTIAAALGAS